MLLQLYSSLVPRPWKEEEMGAWYLLHAHAQIIPGKSGVMFFGFT
jgi:hypothetical protein